ncbi:hypothetical protein CDIK_4550 [Cucumispora dikerogammari]|nr:hypothetical protein CDIK_4550 [Cucumispora dikerogammari]
MYLINLMIHNTYIFYKTFCKQENKLNTHLKLRFALINYFTQTTLLNNIESKNTITNGQLENSLKNSTLTDLLPSKYPSGKSRRCKYCPKAKKKKNIIFLFISATSHCV